MLHNIDINKMNTLTEENPDAKQIIGQLLDNHHRIVSTIAHEIRNPLTLVSSSLQVTELQHPEVKDFSHWKQTIEDIEFICQLLNDLSSFNNGDMLNYSVFSIERLLKNIAVSFAISLDSEVSDIEFSSSIPSDLGDYTGDRVKLEQVFLNLLCNASESICGKGQIYFSAIRTGEFLIIQCKDSGCGISDDVIDYIFEPFKTYKEGGTGLGLSLSKKIIESHRGTISVDSKVDQGSTFTIKLPV
ncbi:sensor histidine kinase [Clostridium sp. C105KSO13]|uniref:sensor histidine kinase n=1 Tax=Clostridium sp. C105KSO13 TaxID=1776045 RepID=UPI0007407931|nr:HAMP domain-containing sensor histidine kinase [Clostridium sp. C105KSO13]CUX37208.1 Sporulation kinase A [Clostridium sp. C105KSO13]